MKKTIIISVILILLGYLLRDNIFYINIGDTYYVISYLSISIFLTCLFFLFYFLFFLFKNNSQ